MKKIMLSLLSGLLVQNVVAMERKDQIITLCRIPVTSCKGLRSMVTCLSQESPLSSYDVQPSALLEYFAGDKAPQSLDDTQLSKTLQSYWQEKGAWEDKYNKIVDLVVKEIQAGEQSALRDCLQEFYQLSAAKAQQIKKNITAIQPDYQQKKRWYNCQMTGNAFFGLTMVAIAVGIGLEVWALTVYCHR